MDNSSSGINNNRIEVVLNCCEREEHYLHKRLSILLCQLWDIPGNDKDILNEIENLYIEKGIIFCNYAYEAGLKDGREIK